MFRVDVSIALHDVGFMVGFWWVFICGASRTLVCVHFGCNHGHAKLLLSSPIQFRQSLGFIAPRVFGLTGFVSGGQLPL